MKEVNRAEFQNGLGAGLSITYRAPAAGTRPLGLAPGVPLDQRLELVRGIGPKTREILVAEGYRTIAQLVRHPRFGSHAGRVFSAIASRDIPALLEAGARDVELSTLFRRDDFAVIDIESVGLWQVLPLFLIGVGRMSGGAWEIKQYFARSFEEEGAVLQQAVTELDGCRVCVTYNGKAFDEPFVRARLGLHGVRPLKFKLHVDLLHSARRVLSDRLPDCRLSTVTEFALGMDREDDVPGSIVPDLYFRYVRDQDERHIEPVLRHNAWDVLALCRLLDVEAIGAPAAVDPVAGAAEGPTEPEEGVG